MQQTAAKPTTKAAAPIWWSNAIFFVSFHLFAVFAVLKLSPWWQLQHPTFWLCMTSWQLATFGITIGYHRLWSHRSFTASLPLRVVLAGMGCLGFQGSIKWWVLRHRLHHRFTDSESDPYNAKEGLYFSHMGWIFHKPVYPRMALVDRKDLDADPVVRFQHRHYLPLTLSLGLVLPTIIGWTYGDAMGGYVWGGIVARLLIWHCTFAINSFAHYLGDQAYSEDVTARGNMLLAIVTGGEANHNYHHAFPKDYRNGPRALDWDPTKWVIWTLHHLTPFVPRVHQTPESEILKARAHVLEGRSEQARANEGDPSSSFARWGAFADGDESEDSGGGSETSEDGGRRSGGGRSSGASSSAEERWSDDADELLEDAPPNSRSSSRSQARKRGAPRWTRAQLVTKVSAMRSSSGSSPLILLLEGWAVDATSYAPEHPGGVAVMRKFAVPAGGKAEDVRDSTEAFDGGLNDHGWSAREKMRGLRVARIVD